MRVVETWSGFECTCRTRRANLPVNISIGKFTVSFSLFGHILYILDSLFPFFLETLICQKIANVNDINFLNILS